MHSARLNGALGANELLPKTEKQQQDKDLAFLFFLTS